MPEPEKPPPAGLAGLLALLALAGCVSPSANTVYDQLGRQVTIVDTGIDPAGGVRLTTIGQFDPAGKYTVLSSAYGPGLAQTVLPSVLAAAGFVGGMQVLRPAEFNNQTSVNATNSGITAASNPAIKTSAAGGTNTSGTATTTATGGSVSATGGAGGSSSATGGTGGAATSTANPTATSTASPDIAPTVNSSNTSSPMFAPQFSPVTTTGGATSSATGGAATATGGQGSCQGNCQ
jgi:hypothetical protein